MDSDAVAEQFVRARLDAAALTDFPGRVPSTLNAAYAYQDRAIALWPDNVAGWKVGRIGPPWLERVGEDRFVGPIFRRAIRLAPPGQLVEFPAFTGGFAAIEAEFVFRLAADAQADKTHWTRTEAAQLVAALHVGIEILGSPLASISELGPVVVVSDFGNNAGLLLGPAIPDWRARALESLTCEVLVEEVSAGRGGALSLPGGPLAGLAFALGRCARRGLPLKAGYVISTGATTGIHAIRSGQSARVRFDGVAELLCKSVPAVKGIRT
ncbi:MAG: 2-keto-4-pentenoate hydratase [Gammaproteobacteria bacterium]|nr:2-keto-4-pentenoate hydratase [Gammaproteobacteria bacterium]